MKTVMVFPGYGSQYVGMAKDFYDDLRVVQECFEEASNCLDINFVKLCFASSDAELSKIENACVALFLVSSSLVAVLASEGIKPDAVAGYDVGEFSSLYAAGSISLPDGLYLIKKYAALYETMLDKKPVGAFHVSGLTLDVIQLACKPFEHVTGAAQIGVYEGKNRFIITGDLTALEDLKKVLIASGGEVKKADVGGGLHSPLMDEVLKSVRIYLEKVDFKDIQIPFISGIAAKELYQADALRAAVMQQIHTAIYWDKVVQACMMYDLVIAIGPGITLEHYFSRSKVISFNKLSDIAELKKRLKKVDHA